MRTTVVRLLGWIGSHERTTLAALTLLGLVGWGFAETADFVIEGESRELDERILLSMRPDLVAHGQAVFSSSFPSGHSMMSAASIAPTCGGVRPTHRPVVRVRSHCR